MKSLSLFAIILSLFAVECCAQKTITLPRAVPSRIATIAEARQLRLPLTTLRVTASSGESEGAPGQAAPSTTIVSTAYKTGSGVVLSPINMYDGSTASTFVAYGVEAYPMTLQTIAQKDPNAYFPIIVSSCASYSPHCVFRAGFSLLPREAHTYVLTFRIIPLSAMTSTQTIKDSLSGSVGDAHFDGSTAVISPTTGEWRVLFNYAARDGSLAVTTDWKNANPNGWGELEFYYVQLQQLD